MTDDIEFDDDSQDENESQPIREIRQQLREEAKARKAAEGRARGSELKAAMADAGVPLNARTKFFLKNYEGESTEPEDVKAALIENGFLDEETPVQEVSPEESQAHKVLSQAAQGADPTKGQSNEEQAHAELRALYDSTGGRSDPFLLQQQAIAIMEKYNQPMTFGSRAGEE